MKGAQEHIVTGGIVVTMTKAARSRARKVKPLRPLGVRALEASYVRDLRKLLDRQETLIKAALDEGLERAIGQAEARLTFDREAPENVGRGNMPSSLEVGTSRLDDGTVEVERMFGDVKAVILGERTPKAIAAVVRSMGQRVNVRSRDNVRRQFKRVLGVDVLAAEPWLADEVAAFTRENVKLIESVADEGLADVEQMVMRNVKAGAGPGRIRQQLEETFDLSRSRADLIARDQTTKFHARLSRLRLQGQGVDRYRWQTSQDQRVRDTHRHLNGTLQNFNRPPVTVTSGRRAGERNNPGEDIQCRCWAEPLIEDLIAA